MTTDFRYTASGLDNIVLIGLEECIDDDGDRCVTIPHITELHRVIAHSILTRESGISGKELRFLRTEMGLTQAELAKIVKREALAIGRWERGEFELDSNAEALIRLVASERLNIKIDVPIEQVSAWCVPSAVNEPIMIDASDPSNYRPIPPQKAA
ncbi:MAG: hypothetical protein P4L57_08995 [Rhizomicrobium sp.]|nr:hypothetical protein [Rhizomicrobium sp.]